jgi:hypothetical protein
MHKNPEKRADVLMDLFQESYQDCSAILVGRKEVIGSTQEHFQGCFSDKIIKLLGIMAA